MKIRKILEKSELSFLIEGKNNSLIVNCPEGIVKVLKEIDKPVCFIILNSLNKNISGINELSEYCAKNGRFINVFSSKEILYLLRNRFRKSQNISFSELVPGTLLNTNHFTITTIDIPKLYNYKKLSKLDNIGILLNYNDNFEEVAFFADNLEGLYEENYKFLENVKKRFTSI